MRYPRLGARTVLALPCVSRKSSSLAKGQRPFGSLAPPTGPVWSLARPTDEQELIPTGLRGATAGLLEDIIVNGIDRRERDASDVGIRYAYAKRFFDADH